jgi:predicted transcriptional regulator
MADEAQVHAVLTALTEGPMTADRVSVSTGLSEDGATKVLEHLVSAVQVAVVPQSEGLPKYQLTPNGVSRLEITNRLTVAKKVDFGEALDALQAGQRKAQQAEQRNERPQDRPQDQQPAGSATGIWSFFTSFWTSQRKEPPR